MTEVLMRHHVISAAIGIVMAAALVPLSVTQAAAADPTGIWRKSEQGERPGKFEIFRCGSGKRYLCAKIVWLKDPLYKGKPLHDIRNENPRLRDRPILGLPMINGMAQVAANQWKGNIYNPEDGNTYSATLTLVSRNQINLRGCKGWILCGERTWVRTSLPKEEPKPEEQIEASAEPESAPETETADATPAPEDDAFANAEMLTPVAHNSTQAGYRFLSASTSAEGQTGFSGENVPSMFAMTKPLPKDDDAADAVAAAESAPAPSEPKVTAAAQPAPQPKPQQARVDTAPAPQAAPNAAAEPGAEPSDGEEPMQTADTESMAENGAAQQRLSWRERRQLRRQQKLQQQQQEAQGLLPWLR
ncbi:MAG TPA: DUF2147 domain-containing protein [Methyloceanibacter sp.]|nr:DUF2147 domain-containing protein [Methyloceanibacter sp.]